MPWAVLILVLAFTANLGWIRARSISDEQNAALQSAEGHFRDVVQDNENRALLVSNGYNRVLAGAIQGLDSPVSPAAVVRRLEVLAPDALPGSLAYFIIPSGADPVWIGDTGKTAAQLHNSDSAPPGLWVGIASHDQGLVAIGYTTDSGDTVAAIATIANLLDLMEAPADHGSHGVDVTLSLPADSYPSPVTLDGELLVMADDHSMDDHATDDSASSNDEVDATHAHGDVAHLHEGSQSFVASREPIMFGQPWHLDIVANEDFLTIPSSREVIVLVGLGVLLSVSLFGLIYFLVRRIFAESQKRAAEERFAAGFNSSPIGVAVLDSTGRILELNGALEQLLGRSALSLSGTPMAELVAEPDRIHWTTRILLPETDSSRHRAEVHYQPSPDRSVWVDETATFLSSEDGQQHILLQMSDVTEQRASREELQRLVLHDKLTGLANRALLEDRLQQALHRSQRTSSIAAVMFIDVDQFKTVNDTLGHGAGDQLLVELATRLQTITREEDTIARFGGDEFVMLCESLSSQGEIWKIADRIRTQVAAPFGTGDRSISVTVSIGIALCGPDDSTEAMIRDADLAMYQGKKLGRNRAILFEREMREDLIEQLELEGQLLNALKEDELELYYQPVIRIGDNHIIGFEALARWNHPLRGVLAPDAFLPAAAQLGLLPAIDAWALTTATHQLVAWTKELPEAADWTIAVNAAATNFNNPEFPAIVTKAVTLAGVDADRIVIELTEDAILANTDTASSVIKQIRLLGVHIAIDDFGTGYSSLSQLAALDVDILKIDKSHVANLEQSPFNEIVHAIIGLARALGIRTVAEGVETNEHLALLRQFGADEAQGYLISRPVPADQVRTLTTEQLETPSLS
jgi:diguanylate cyclase (GGDEF)-like protein/PAS domain S-box-containing protein